MIFPVVYLDPPWPYAVWSVKGAGRTAEAYYATMTWDRLFFELGPAVRSVSADNAAIILWAVPPSYDTMFRMADQWGLQYKTKLFCWVKRARSSFGDGGIHLGLGYYTRANTEDAFLFTWRGKDNPKTGDRGVPQVAVTVEQDTESYLLPLTRHSEKPDLFRERIESLFKGPYLEVFARKRTNRDQWSAVGNEVDGLDVVESLGRVRDNKPLPSILPAQSVLGV